MSLILFFQRRYQVNLYFLSHLSAAQHYLRSTQISEISTTEIVNSVNSTGFDRNYLSISRLDVPCSQLSLISQPPLAAKPGRQRAVINQSLLCISPSLSSTAPHSTALHCSPHLVWSGLALFFPESSTGSPTE